MRRRGPSTGRGTGCASLWPLLLLLTAAGVHTPGTAAAPAPVATAAPSEQSPATAWRSPFAALRNTDVLFEAAVRSNPQCHTDLARTYMTDACDPEHFTVIITTGGSRLPALKKVLDSYRRSKLVDKIILIWNNPSEPVAALKQVREVACCAVLCQTGRGRRAVLRPRCVPRARHGSGDGGVGDHRRAKGCKGACNCSWGPPHVLRGRHNRRRRWGCRGA